MPARAFEVRLFGAAPPLGGDPGAGKALVDGAGDQADGAATLNYALSPQDLCGLEDVEALTNAGVHCLKIEGRLKDERYVAATTRAYREAVDAAWAKLKGEEQGRSLRPSFSC